MSKVFRLDTRHFGGSHLPSSSSLTKYRAGPQELKNINPITPALTETSLTWSYKLALYKDAWSAFLAKPIFGWGDGSFCAR